MDEKTKRHQQSTDKPLFCHLTPDELARLLPECYAGRRQTLSDLDEKIDKLLPPATGRVPLDPKALFLGPKAENAEFVERLLLSIFRDHVFWRRNFHPEDFPAIQPEDRASPGFEAFKAHFQRELAVLMGELKSSIPCYSPRYIGHMLADTSLPALLGFFTAMLYNSNNVCWEVSPLTTLMEIEVGRSIARMLGFGRTAEELAGTWGHLTSGGTAANIEAMWVAKALKFLPASVRFAAEALGVSELMTIEGGRRLDSLNAWELVNLLPEQALNLKDQLICASARAHPEQSPAEAAETAMSELKGFDIMTLGDWVFYDKLKNLGRVGSPVILAAQSMHYCILKGAALVGLGGAQVVPVPVDRRFRMDISALRELLERAKEERRPVMMVVGVLGSTEEGAIDPIDEVADLRDELAGSGQAFYLHCDAAYGGYMASCFREPSGALRALAEMQQEYHGWPEPKVYDSFAATGRADSATVDPHKLGYIPYPAGAVVFGDSRVKELVAQEAAYALGGRSESAGEISIGKYILEGSKPGAAAAAVFLAHRVVPPDHTGYGRLLGLTARTARLFYWRLLAFGEEQRSEYRIVPLFLPDTNIVNFCINPVGNRRLDRMNRFSLALYRELSIAPEDPIQTRQFFVSHTEFVYEKCHVAVILSLLTESLGVDGQLFVPSQQRRELARQGQGGADNEVVVFRSVFMNPYTLEKASGERDYLDLFFEALPELMQRARSAIDDR